MSTDTTRICLGAAPLTASIAVSDMGAAREFYEDRLGLRAAQEQTDGSRLYASASGASLHVYASPEHAGKATATLATWYVDDLECVVDELAGRGVRFERYDDPALRADERGICEVEGGGRVAWLRDPDGNTFALEERPAGEGLPGALRRVEVAVRAMAGGDPAPYTALWEEGPDVTLFGAWGPIERGAEALRRTFEWVGSRFGGGELVPENVVVHESGDLACTVGFERGTVSVDGGDPQPMTIRVTHVYRRGDGEWRLVHRHADFPPRDQRTATRRQR